MSLTRERPNVHSKRRELKKYNVMLSICLNALKMGVWFKPSMQPVRNTKNRRWKQQ